MVLAQGGIAKFLYRSLSFRCGCRFKLMNFLGCTSAMKANAEKYVKANYVANWAPEQHVASVVLALIQPKK